MTNIGNQASEHTDDPDTAGATIPPYEGRQESGEVHPSPTDAESAGGGHPAESDAMKSPGPEDTPGGATASPSDEQPAEESADTAGTDDGTGPAHQPGQARAED